jgi:hypothetical protein
MGALKFVFVFHSTAPLELGPKLMPLIVTTVPWEPPEGVTDWMTGHTVNGTALLGWLPTVTTTLPLVAPEGTGAVMVEPFQLAGVSDWPFRVMVLAPWEEPTLVP